MQTTAREDKDYWSQALALDDQIIEMKAALGYRFG
jgi:hypothetical protein